MNRLVIEVTIFIPSSFANNLIFHSDPLSRIVLIDPHFRRNHCRLINKLEWSRDFHGKIINCATRKETNCLEFLTYIFLNQIRKYNFIAITMYIHTLDKVPPSLLSSDHSSMESAETPKSLRVV